MESVLAVLIIAQPFALHYIILCTWYFTKAVNYSTICLEKIFVKIVIALPSKGITVTKKVLINFINMATY